MDMKKSKLKGGCTQRPVPVVAFEVEVLHRAAPPSPPPPPPPPELRRPETPRGRNWARDGTLRGVMKSWISPAGTRPSGGGGGDGGGGADGGGRGRRSGRGREVLCGIDGGRCECFFT